MLLSKPLGLMSIGTRSFFAWLKRNKGFPGGSVVKNLPANAGDTALIPESGRSHGEGNGNPLQGWRSLVGYSQWGFKESDMTEH